MRVFVTGASGFIGTVVVQELLKAGHTVIGLARSDKSAAALTAAGAEVLRGDLEDLPSLKKGVSQSDGVIHLAFPHEYAFTDFPRAAKVEQTAISAMCDLLAGSNKPFVGTSGLLGLKSGVFGSETDGVDTEGPLSMRSPAETIALASASKGVRASIVRLSPTVHGDGDKGFIPMLINGAREKGEVWQVGNGLNRWPAVHLHDAAKVYRLAVEKGEAGSVFHAVQDEAVPLKDILAVLAKRLGLPLVVKTKEEAMSGIGFMAIPLSADNPAYSKITKEKLGWTPQGVGLLEDLEKGTYFT